MTEPDPPNAKIPMAEWTRILAPTDFSPSAESAMRSAEYLCRQERARLDLLHVIQLPAPSYLGRLGLDRDLRQTWIVGAREQLAELARGFAGSELEVETILREGKPWSEILDVARERGTDLICLGNSGHSALERMLLGSSAENVVRRSDVPVLIVRDRPLTGVRRILVPVDFDPGTKVAIRFALAKFPAAEISALHVVAPLPPADPVVGPLVPNLAAIREKIRRLLDNSGAREVTESVRLMADPAEAVLEAARETEVDLLVLTTHGRRGVKRAMLGSVAEKVVRHADRPVLVLPGPGRERKPREATAERETS
jgi:nucleotide-binding universal stress UspA family protein